jgi:methylmalonyl-CoA/ethylmalonyl-CoA epimerase
MDKIRTTQIRQIGILVRDLEKAVAAYEKFLGRKADFVGITDEYEVTKQELWGKPCYGRCYQALFNLDNIQIELISPYGEGDSVWRECLEKDGEGLHHLAFKTSNIQGAIKEVEKRSDAKLMQYGTWPDSPKYGQYAYMDCRSEIRTIIELLEANEGEKWDTIEGVEF